jgi:hypothetical protein
MAYQDFKVQDIESPDDERLGNFIVKIPKEL